MNKEVKIHFLEVRPLFCLSVKNQPNLATDISGHSMFFSTLFDLWGRTIGQLATWPWFWLWLLLWDGLIIHIRFSLRLGSFLLWHFPLKTFLVFAHKHEEKNTGQYRWLFILLTKQMCRYPIWVAVLNRGLSGNRSGVASDGDQYSARWTTWMSNPGMEKGFVNINN